MYKYTPNQKINNLIVIKIIEPHIYPNGKPARKALFKCFCGKEFKAIISNVRKKATKSCGCLRKETTSKRFLKHGQSQKHPLYGVWVQMKNRCHNPNTMGYKHWGGRGITICSEWKHSFQKFYGWCVGNGYQNGLVIDRKVNDKNYEPNNCRFITHAENNRNQSSTKLSWDIVNEIRNIKLLIPEISQTEIAEIYGVSHQHISGILRNKAWVEI